MNGGLRNNQKMQVQLAITDGAIYFSKFLRYIFSCIFVRLFKMYRKTPTGNDLDNIFSMNEATDNTATDNRNMNFFNKLP